MKCKPIQHGFFFLSLVAAGWALILPAGCSRPDSSGQQPAEWAKQETVENGPVMLTIKVDNLRPQIAQPVRVRLEVVAPENVSVNLPDIKNHWGDWQAKPLEAVNDLPHGQKQRLWMRDVQIDSLQTGACPLPPLTVTFQDRRGPTPKSGQLNSPSIPLTVVSVLEGKANPRAFRDIKGEVDIAQEEKSTWVYWVAGAAGGVVLASSGIIVCLTLLRRRRIPPYRWAQQQLQALREENLPAQQKYDEFFVRYTDILRSYVERRWHITAPAMTTREFLMSIQPRLMLRNEQKLLLGECLCQADLVKFARFQPNDHACRSALDLADQFIAATANDTEEEVAA